MVDGPGHIALQRALASIRVGRRHRQDLGDVDALAASIQREGLLQPVTITPDGVLVCGLRRLAAMRQLGWKTANVWVRSGITQRLGELLAEQDENTLHKPLSQTEAAALYTELKTLLAEDAARRQEASRFTARGQNPRLHGAATVAAPSHDPVLTGSGDTRVQAALMVTGRNSYTSLERIGQLQHLAADMTQPAQVRERAAAELASIDAGGSITAAHQRTRTAVSLAQLDHAAADPHLPMPIRRRATRDAAQLRAADEHARAVELESLAAAAVDRIRGNPTRNPRTPLADPSKGTAEFMTVRAFVLTWDELAHWWEHADPRLIGPALTDQQWHRFQQTAAGTAAFAQDAEAARSAIQAPDTTQAHGTSMRRRTA